MSPVVDRFYTIQDCANFCFSSSIPKPQFKTGCITKLEKDIFITCVFIVPPGTRCKLFFVQNVFSPAV